jgi:hypothetical protein
MISARIYKSSQYLKMQEWITKKNKYLPLFTVFCTAVFSLSMYFIIVNFCYTKYNYEYAGPFVIINVLDNMQNSLYISLEAIGLFNLIMMFSIFSIISTSHLIIKAIGKFAKEERLAQLISYIAYPTYCVYLLHRPFIMLLSSIATGIFNFNMYAPENIYIELIFVPVIFLLSFLVQKGYDTVLKRSLVTKQKLIKKIAEIRSTPKNVSTTS